MSHVFIWRFSGEVLILTAKSALARSPGTNTGFHHLRIYPPPSIYTIQILLCPPCYIFLGGPQALVWPRGRTPTHEQGVLWEGGLLFLWVEMFILLFL